MRFAKSVELPVFGRAKREQRIPDDGQWKPYTQIAPNLPGRGQLTELYTVEPATVASNANISFELGLRIIQYLKQ